MDKKFFELIKHAQFDNHIFLLGNYEGRITVHSQQIRSANLIYSLFKVGMLKEDSRVAVLGAGTAGLMVGASAALLGCKHIQVFEKGTDVLPLWRNCSSRWLDPNIFDWPNSTWSSERTSLPILNWKCDKAETVAQQITKEWNTLFDYYNSKANLKISFSKSARVIKDSNRVLWGKHGDSDEFDLIFLGVGFGRDGKNFDENTCYWANDNIESAGGCYFISGVGDGGIADLLRVRVKDYTLPELRTWLQTDEVMKIAPQIETMEKAAMTLEISKGAKDVDRFLNESYGQIKTPQLSEIIRSKLRRDTSVIFHSRNEQYYKLSAFPLNRFLLSRYLQLKDESFNFVTEEIENFGSIKTSAKKTIKVHLQDQTPINVNTFITRHGPSSPMKDNGLNWIDKAEAAKEIKARNKLDQTGRVPIYSNEDFLEQSEFLKQINGPVGDRIALAIVKHKRGNKFLFTKRKKAEDHLTWGFPAKRVRSGYDVKKALIMECEQETGIKPKPIRFIGQRIHKETGQHLEYWYCTHDGGRLQLKDTNELSEVKWIEGTEIIRMTRDLFEPLKEILNG